MNSTTPKSEITNNPVTVFPITENETENLSINTPIETFTESSTTTDEYPKPITDCLCIQGMAGMQHIQTDYCLVVTENSPVADEEPTLEDIDGIVKRGRGRPPKEDHELVDPESAGRKRAAAKVQIKNQRCEWTYHAKAGGGVKPIVGCIGYPAVALHHGPDKSTLNNTRPEDVGEGEPYNLHAICVFCHNRWHVANDKFFGDNGALDRPEDNSAWVPIGEYEEHKPGLLLDTVHVMMEEMSRLKLEKAEGNDFSIDVQD